MRNSFISSTGGSQRKHSCWYDSRHGYHTPLRVWLLPLQSCWNTGTDKHIFMVWNVTSSCLLSCPLVRCCVKCLLVHSTNDLACRFGFSSVNNCYVIQYKHPVLSMYGWMAQNYCKKTQKKNLLTHYNRNICLNELFFFSTFHTLFSALWQTQYYGMLTCNSEKKVTVTFLWQKQTWLFLNSE